MINKSNKKGFTLIELLVVISIIGILSSTVMASLNSAREKARDARRLADMAQVKTALELYYDDNNQYPSTGGTNVTYADPGCGALTAPDTTTADWIPGLVASGYMKVLPHDPRPKDNARNYGWPYACYMYASDGQLFILSAWATVETGPNTQKMYSRAGFRESLYSNQSYLCNHPNIGSEVFGDYYKHSYTITNINCTW